MNIEAPAPPPHQPPAQPPHRVSATCHRHPDLPFTGFCASCLRERLLSLESSQSQSQSQSQSTTTSSATASAAAAAQRFKSIFRSTSDNNNNNNNNNHRTTASNSNRGAPSSSNSLLRLPELRRSKSFSAAGRGGEGLSGVVVEPQRRSCDVRVVRSTLWSLFNQDDVGKHGVDADIGNARVLGVSTSAKDEDIRVSNVSVLCVQDIVEEAVEEEEEEEEQEEEQEEIIEEELPVEEEIIEPEIREEEEEEIREEEEEEIEELKEEFEHKGGGGEEEEEEEEEKKKMKDHIEQETQSKKAGRDLKESFLFAASAFGRKWQNWRRKHKSTNKKHGDALVSSTTMQLVDKPYSEVADYGFGRRSCDTDPRFSLDAAAARMSFDDPRYSWDEPRASWDGYLIGRTFPRMPPPMVSVVEDAPVITHVVPRSDNQIPVEEPRVSVSVSVSDNDVVPGGSLQTRDYYSDSQRRRKSFERSNSMRKKSSAGIVAEAEEEGKVVVVGNVAKEVSPPTSSDQIVQKDNCWRESNSNSNSLREDYSGSLESGAAFKDSASVCGGIERKGSKKSRRWSKPWNIWALIYRRNGSKDEEEERYHRGNVVERSLSESWQELRREPNGDSKGAFSRVFRSNSSVSARHSFSSVKSCAEANGNGNGNGNGKKRRDEFVLERNRSARYSPTNIDNGLLRFYLAPTTRRNGSVKSKPKNSSHSITNSVLRLY